MDKEELLIIEPIIGYRFWDIYCEKKNDKYILRLQGIGAGSVQNKASVWDKGINIAKCLTDKPVLVADGKPVKQKHKIPEFNCSCGFYIYKYKIDFFKLLFNLNDSTYFCGLVELTGKVIEHTAGYRAEKAEIKKLIWCRDEEKINLSYEDKDKKKEKKDEEKEEEQIDLANSIQQLTAWQNATQQYYQKLNYQMLPQQRSPSFPTLNYSCSINYILNMQKEFTKDEIIKQISDYYKVPIIYYKDYLERELLK